MSGLAHFVAVAFASLVALFPSAAAAPVAPPPAPPPKIIPHATVLFGGDMMFDRSIRSTIKEKDGDFIFSCIDPVLEKADLVVANLEGPITDNPSKSVGTSVGGEGNYTFTFAPTTAALLFAHHVNVVNLGNNHILNFGARGASSTMRYLGVAGVGYFGDPLEQTVAKKETNGIPLTFINYNEFSSGGGNASSTAQQIQDARAAGELPIVYTHWGIEYATTSPARVQALAHEFVEAGAEIVIGSHPHVVEEREFYAGKYIYYSLGNLIFDQYWNDDVTHGLMVSVVFDPNGVEYVQEIPVELQRDRRTCPMER